MLRWRGRAATKPHDASTHRHCFLLSPVLVLLLVLVLVLERWEHWSLVALGFSPTFSSLELDMFKMAIPPRAPPVVQNTSFVGSFGFALHFLLRCDLKKLTVGWHTAGPFDDDSLPPTTYFFVPTAPLTTSLKAADRHPAALWHSEGVNCDWSSQIQARF